MSQSNPFQATVSRQRSLEQKRADEAWTKVTQVKQQKYAKDYGQLARRAPADIQANGLGQTLAFWRAKGEDHHQALFSDVSTWVKGQLKFNEANLLEWIIKEATTDQYRRATAETIAFLIWVKRFAEAELGEVGS